DGAQPFVFGTSIKINVSSGSSLTIGPGGSAGFVDIYSSGQLDAQSGGFAFDPTIHSGGFGSIESGGFGSDIVVSSGAQLDLFGSAVSGFVGEGSLRKVFRGR